MSKEQKLVLLELRKVPYIFNMDLDKAIEYSGGNPSGVEVKWVSFITMNKRMGVD